MAGFRRTARKQPRQPLTIEQLTERFRNISMRPRESVGEFTARYHHAWKDSYGGGFSDYESARRLAELLPITWSAWFYKQIESTKTELLPGYVRVVNFPHMVIRLQTRYILGDEPPYPEPSEIPPP